MKKYALIIVMAFVSMACNTTDVTPEDMLNDMKNNMEKPTDPSKTEGQTLLFQSEFENASHPTSGTVKIYENKNGVRTVFIENLKSDSGPDLRIYLAEDKKAKGFTQLADKVKNGNTEIELPAMTDLKKQTHILIWCKQFSVLFGSANLK